MSGLAVLCPGQGGQHPGMLDLAAGTPAGAAVLRACGSAIGEDLVAIARRGGPEAFANALAQPLVCAAALATWAALREALPAPRLFAGYSVGELAAHGCAGALSPAETVSLARARAGAMDRAAAEPGGLVGIRGIPLARAEALAAGTGCEIAIVNGPDHCVAGGRTAALAALEVRAAAAGATAIQRLPIGVAAHTSLLGAAVAPFAAALGAAPLRAPRVPVLAGISAEPVRTREGAIETLSAQLARRIEWARCLATAEEMGATVLLDLGPGSALARMARETLPAAEVRSVAEFRSIAGVAAWVRGRMGP